MNLSFLKEIMGKDKPENYLPPYVKLKNEMGQEDIYYSTRATVCPEVFKPHAEKELHETEENKIHGIRKLRDFMKREGMADIEDFMLIAILRCCKYNMKKSQTRLKKVMKMRRWIIAGLKEADMNVMERIVDDGIVDCLPFTDKQGSPIYYCRPNMNLDLYSIDEVALCLAACSFSTLSYPLPTINGAILILDSRCKSPSTFIDMLKAYKKYMGFDTTVPLRCKRIDVVNENAFLHYLFAFLRPLLPNKIVERIAFHGENVENLHKLYPPELLPEELGGALGPMNTTFFKENRMNTIKKLRAESLL